MSLKDKIKKLIKVIKDTEIEEIEVSSFWGIQKIRLSKKAKSIQPVQTQSSISTVKDVTIPIESNTTQIDKSDQSADDNKDPESTIQTPIDSDLPIQDENLNYQKAPLVGTFYISPKPGEPPFVQVGQKVAKGQTLCIIEAMKIFNEIESDFDGEIVEILVNDSTPVEFNQPIFTIR